MGCAGGLKPGDVVIRQDDPDADPMLVVEARRADATHVVLVFAGEPPMLFRDGHTFTVYRDPARLFADLVEIWLAAETYR